MAVEKPNTAEPPQRRYQGPRVSDTGKISAASSGVANAAEKHKPVVAVASSRIAAQPQPKPQAPITAISEHGSSNNWLAGPLNLPAKSCVLPAALQRLWRLLVS